MSGMDRDQLGIVMSSLRRAFALVLISAACGDVEGSRPRAERLTARQASVAALRDTTVAEAERALAQGRPWHATELLAPVLADSARRTPQVLLLAATAAA